MNTLDLKKVTFNSQGKYFEKRKLNLIVISSALFSILCGTVLLIHGSFLFIAFYIPGLFFLFVFKGMMIDLEQNKIQEYTSIFGYKYGSWYDLDDFSFIQVSATSMTYRSGFESIIHEIHLLSNDKETQHNLLLAEYKDREEAIQEANKIGELIKFNVKINKLN